MRKRLICASVLAIIALIALQPLAGDLDPPGAPASTPGPEPRTAITALPVSIEGPGSFYLVADLTGSAGVSGIAVSGEGATLDLNGFSLIGVPGSLSGITLTGRGHRIVNGTIRDWDGYGIFGGDGFLIPGGDGTLLQDVRVHNSGQRGARVGEGSIVRNCVFSDNGDIGLWARDASTVESCVARGNADAGFLLDALCSGRGLTASLNGSVGIVANVHAALINCTATENMGGGISVNRASLVNCTANRNTGSGIRGFFFSATSCTAADNIFDGEATDPTGVGFRLGGACLVTDSVARGNAAIGILVEDGSILAMGSTVIGCEVNLNGNNFIGVPEPLAGILVTGVANRIDGNTVTGSPRGIHVTGTDNLIVRNAASDSSTANFDIATDNAFGPIINVARIGDITTAVGDTHPWANFEF